MWPFNRRSHKLPYNKERVLIIGASSGLGRAVAHRYASRGARLCIVARREDELARVVEECKEHRAKGTNMTEIENTEEIIFAVRADFTDIDDVLRVRSKVEEGMLRAITEGMWLTSCAP